MGLDAKVLRLAESLDGEIQRVIDKHRARIAGFDDAAYDEKNARVTFRRGDEVLYNGLAEEIGTLTHDGVFRWGWAERPGASKRTRVEVVKGDFDRFRLEQLQAQEIKLDDKADVEKVVRIAMHFSHADTLYRNERSNRTVFLALFEAAGLTAPRNRIPSERLGRRRESGEIPAIRRPLSSNPDSQPMQSRPPIIAREEGNAAPRIETLAMPKRTLSSGTVPVAAQAPISSRPNQLQVQTPPPASGRVVRVDPPSPSLAESSNRPPPVRASSPDLLNTPKAPPSRPAPVPIREPTRGIFIPVAQAVFADITSVIPGRVQQAVVIITSKRDETHEFSIEVVAVDAKGYLRALEPTHRLRAVVAEMIMSDAQGGNGRWRRLVADITMASGEPTLRFEVK